MNRTYIEWLDYYENATKEDIIQDMMLDINSIKEQKQQIQELTNNWNELEEYIIQQMKLWDRDVYMTYKEVLDKMKEIKDGNNDPN